MVFTLSRVWYYALLRRHCSSTTVRNVPFGIYRGWKTLHRDWSGENHQKHFMKRQEFYLCVLLLQEIYHCILRFSIIKAHRNHLSVIFLAFLPHRHSSFIYGWEPPCIPKFDDYHPLCSVLMSFPHNWNLSDVPYVRPEPEDWTHSQMPHTVPAGIDVRQEVFPQRENLAPFENSM